MAKETKIIEWGDRIYRFNYEPFDAEVDMDDLTIIHYDNLYGEIVTIAALMNRVGILKADADNALNLTKLSHRILEARKGDHYRKSLTKKENDKVKAPTVAQVEDAIAVDEEVSTSKRNYYKMQHQADIMDSLYWSVKAKEQKLNQISQGIIPSDFQNEIMEGVVNSISLKSIKKNF